MHRIIVTQPGIGDSIWILQKLINQNHKFIFHLPNGQPQRGHQIFDVCPQVSAGVAYMPNLSYRKIEANSIHHEIPYWKKIKARRFFLSINSHLEQGKRIEEFLPDLPTSFLMDWQTGVELPADMLTDKDYKYIGIYCSAYAGNEKWSGWKAPEWYRLCELIQQKLKGRARFVMIGAAWDLDLSTDVMGLMDHDEYINRIGTPLGVTIEIMKRLDYFVGYPSGMSILNETLGKDGFMFYPPALEKMINAWADPMRIQNGNYIGALFDTPEKSFEKFKERL